MSDDSSRGATGEDGSVPPYTRDAFAGSVGLYALAAVLALVVVRLGVLSLAQALLVGVVFYPHFLRLLNLNARQFPDRTILGGDPDDALLGSGGDPEDLYLVPLTHVVSLSVIGLGGDRSFTVFLLVVYPFFVFSTAAATVGLYAAALFHPADLSLVPEAYASTVRSVVAITTGYGISELASRKAEEVFEAAMVLMPDDG
jgi:hypothetical protein